MRSQVIALGLLALIVVVVQAYPPKWHQLQDYTFEQYIQDFQKSYATAAETAKRQQLFEVRMKEIAAHNSNPVSTWKMGINHMSDWTNEEFQRLNGGRIHQMQRFEDKSMQTTYKPKSAKLPSEVDIRNNIPSILTAVKDQGMCGSCWAHGSTEQMESYWAIATGNLFVLSQQQVTACAPNPQKCGGTGGCGGSTAELAFEYVVNAGLTQEWQYPYTAYTGTTGTCNAQNQSWIKLSGYTKVASNDQGAVMDALASTGPLAVNVDASAWSMYETGVFNGCDYAKNISIDHVVQLVGYGSDKTNGQDYWIIRNSWSPFWGENGFIRLLRTKTAECGWDIDPQDGTGCSGGPPQLWVCGMCGVLYDTSFPLTAPS